MIKKTFIGFMVFAILNLIGCYSFQTVSSETINKYASVDGSEAIELTTKDHIEYRFNKYSYRVKNDTITGNGYVIQLNDEVPFNGRIAFEDIIAMNVEKLDAVASIGLAFGVAIIGLIIVFVVGMSAQLNK
jgi:hypothetical protein